MRAHPLRAPGVLAPAFLLLLLSSVAAPPFLASPAQAVAAARAPETLKPIAALPAHIAGSFQELTACRQTAQGDYFIFDRRSHAVYTAPRDLDAARKLIEIGAEKGRILDPTAFDLAPDGTFVVADAPSGRPRIQMFTASGSTLNGFFLPGRFVSRISIRNLVLNGIAAIEYTGRSLIFSQPELGALIVEYSTDGTPRRMFGELRRTGHEDDPDVHLALNAGVVVSNQSGGFYFVFLGGLPVFRKYDSGGKLVFERHIEGAELDHFIQSLPTTWKRHRTDEGMFPLVLPSVYAAAADAAGNLWVSLAAGVTYVYDQDGQKRRTIQFRGAGAIQPTSLSFAATGRLLVTPGCFAFDVK